MKNALGNIMQQAQKMQDDFKKAQEELNSMQVMGESGGGLVTILMTGKREARKVIKICWKTWSRRLLMTPSIKSPK